MKYTKKLTLDEIQAARAEAEETKHFQECCDFWKYPMRKSPKRPRFECPKPGKSYPLHVSRERDWTITDPRVGDLQNDWSIGTAPTKDVHPDAPVAWRLELAKRLPKKLTATRLIEQTRRQLKNLVSISKTDLRTLRSVGLELAKDDLEVEHVTQAFSEMLEWV
jgi:hypothetical protein